jgi:hypothetical protein
MPPASRKRIVLRKARCLGHDFLLGEAMPKLQGMSVRPAERAPRAFRVCFLSTSDQAFRRRSRRRDLAKYYPLPSGVVMLSPRAFPILVASGWLATTPSMGDEPAEACFVEAHRLGVF